VLLAPSPAPPPAEVIVLNIELFPGVPFAAGFVGAQPIPPLPPPPTVIG
jgi:hypothetical protein